MSTARSAFTEAIEDHLALKKQNAPLESAMPIARYDVGDPLDRYPGGHGRAAGVSADETMVIAEDVDAASPSAAAAPSGAASAAMHDVPLVGPSPEQAMEAATSLEPAFTDRPFEPLGGMTPMLSLVEDIEDEDESSALENSGSIPVAGANVEPSSADVLRFPGGVGPRTPGDAPSGAAAPAASGPTSDQSHLTIDERAFDMTQTAMPPVAAPTTPQQVPGVSMDALTGEHPVLVIDAEEPIGAADTFASEPAAPVRSSGRRKPRFFGLGRKKQDGDGSADGWFTDGPRDFNWD